MTAAMPSLVLATSNAAKRERLRWVVEGLGFQIVTPDDLSGAEVEETGASFAENAAAKARAWSRAAGGVAALATDGGLRIPALGAAWDMLRTRRNAGPD